MPFSQEQLEQMLCHILLHGKDAIKYNNSRTDVRRFEKSFHAAAALQSYLRENYTALSPQDVAGSYQKHCPTAFQRYPHYRPNLLERIVDQSIECDFLNSRIFQEFFNVPFTSNDFLAREETVSLILQNDYFNQINSYLKRHRQTQIDFVPILKEKIKQWITSQDLMDHVITFLSESGQPFTLQFLREALDCPDEPLSAIIKKAFETKGQDREMYSRMNGPGSYGNHMFDLLKALIDNGDSVDLEDFYFGINSSYFVRDMYAHTSEPNRPLLKMHGSAENLLQDEDCLKQLTRHPNPVLFLQKIWESVPEDQREALQNIYANAFNSAFTAQALGQRGMFSASSR